MATETSNTFAPKQAPAVLTQRLFDKTQLAETLGVSVRTLDNLVKQEELPPGVRIGRNLYWCADVMDTWFRQRFAAQRVWKPSF